VLGGSASDDELFRAAFVLHDGTFHQGHTVLAAISTTLEIKPFQTHPFFGSGAPLVVTEVIESRRTIKEINGRSAVTEYAAAIGLVPSRLGPTQFANSPLVVRINGADFVRAIQSANPDGGLTLYCAIATGVVLRIGRKTDLLQNRQALLDSLRRDLGNIEFILGFECILNKRESIQSREIQDIENLYKECRVFGFNTYGEQYQGLHMNQTLTGIAFGSRIFP